MSLLVRCPDFRGCTAHKRVFGTAKCVLLSRCPISDCPEIKAGGLAFTSKHWHVRTSKTMKRFVNLNGCIFCIKVMCSVYVMVWM